MVGGVVAISIQPSLAQANLCNISGQPPSDHAEDKEGVGCLEDFLKTRHFESIMQPAAPMPLLFGNKVHEKANEMSTLVFICPIVAHAQI